MNAAAIRYIQLPFALYSTTVATKQSTFRTQQRLSQTVRDEFLCSCLRRMYLIEYSVLSQPYSGQGPISPTFFCSRSFLYFLLLLLCSLVIVFLFSCRPLVLPREKIFAHCSAASSAGGGQSGDAIATAG